MSSKVTLVARFGNRRSAPRFALVLLLVMMSLIGGRFVLADSSTAVLEALTDNELSAMLEEAQLSDVRRDTTDDGRTLLKLKLVGKDVGVVHDADLKHIEFVVMFSDKQRLPVHKLLIANKWNRRQQGPRAVVIKGDLWALALDLSYRHGVSAEQIAATLRGFAHGIPLFVQYVRDDGVNPVDVDFAPRSETTAKVSVDTLRRAFQRAGETEFRPDDSDDGSVTFHVQSAGRSLTAVHHRRSGQLSLHCRHQSPGTITEEQLDRANTWNRETGIGRVSLHEASLTGEHNVVWGLQDDFLLTEPFSEAALVGFIHEFVAVTHHFHAYASGGSDRIPKLAERLNTPEATFGTFVEDESGSPVPGADQLRTFQVQDIPISFSYPREWSEVTSAESEYVINLGDDVRVKICRVPKSRYPDGSAWQQMLLAQDQLTQQGGQVVRMDAQTVAEREAPYALVALPIRLASGETIALNVLQLVIDHRESYYWISFAGPNKAWERNAPRFKQLLESLRMKSN